MTSATFAPPTDAQCARRLLDVQTFDSPWDGMSCGRNQLGGRSG